jgi:hypothetical protein
MTSNSDPNSRTGSEPKEDPAASFLSDDYNYACSQMKYYDTLINDYVKYLFTVYASIISVVAILEKFGISTANDNTLAAAQLLLFIGFCIGILLAILIVRTRIYFVIVAQYANALRGFFFSNQTGTSKFMNPSKMWVDPDKPDFKFNWRSAHTWLVFIPILMNSVVFGVLIYLFIKSYNPGIIISIVPGIVMFCIQIVAIWIYLNSKIETSNVECVVP